MDKPISIRWSPEAVEDLESIANYIARDSELYAKEVISKVVDTANLLPENPKIGCKVPELNTN